jgi:hypothetical protein
MVLQSTVVCCLWAASRQFCEQKKHKTRVTVRKLGYRTWILRIQIWSPYRPNTMLVWIGSWLETVLHVTVLTRATRRNFPADAIVHSHCRENLKFYIALTSWIQQWRSNVSPVRYELGFYIPEDDILHSHSRENLKSYIALTGWTLQWRGNVSPVKYEQGFYIPEDDILHSHCRENLKSYRNSLLSRIECRLLV